MYVTNDDEIKLISASLNLVQESLIFQFKHWKYFKRSIKCKVSHFLSIYKRFFSSIFEILSKI